MSYKKGLAVFFLLFVVFGAIFASDLLEVETTHFTIIYDESSKESAALIASSCEDTYDYLCSLFKTDPDLHLPVILTTQTKVLNAYFTPSPSNHIVLYDVVAEKGSLTSFSETLTSVFKHELTHAFTMNLRSSFWQVLANFFGDYINPSTFLYSYQSMTEGIAVTTESLEGYGRMNDLYSYRIVYQAKVEGKFPSWVEISGARDTYPASLIPYIFGGAFLTYLCDTYGTDVVYEIFVNFKDINWFKDTAGIIETTIGVNFDTLWNDFYESIEVPTNLVESTKVNGYKKAGSFDGLKTLSDGSVVFHDSASYSLYKLTSDLGKSSKLIDDLTYANEYAVSEDGAKLLIPYVLEDSNFVKVLTSEGKVLKTFRFDDKDVRGGVFTEDGVLLYVAKEQETFLELYDSNYEFVSSISLGYGAVASSLTNCKDGKIAFIYTLNGADNLAFLKLQDMSVEVYESPVSMRIFYLSLAYEAEENLLSFTWFPSVDSIEENENDSPVLGAYGEFILDDGSFRLSKANVSGGVNSPLRLKDTVLFSANYYEGATLNTVSIEALALEEKVITSHSTLVAQAFDSSKLEALSGSKKYNAFDNMNNGVLLPLGGYLDGSNGMGLTWSVTDPTGQYNFNMTVFSDLLGFYSLGLWGTDNLQLGPVALPVTVGTKFTSGWFFFNFQIQPSYSYSFDAGKQLTIADKIADTLVLYKGQVRNSIHNIFAISYTSATNTGLGFNKTKGYKLQFALTDIDPSFTAQVRIPMLFALSLTGTAKYSVSSKNLALEGKGNLTLFNLEIQNGTRILDLYVKRVTLDTVYHCNYSVSLKTFEQTISLRAYVTFAPLLGTFASSLELKMGAVLSYNPAEESPTVTFTIIE